MEYTFVGVSRLIWTFIEGEYLNEKRNSIYYDLPLSIHQNL